MGRGRFCSYACEGRHRHRQSPEDRFWGKVEKRGPDDCWLWMANVGTHGYGQLTIERGRVVTAHRFSFELHNGPIRRGALIRHTCDNKRCVNPAHLLTGSHVDNWHDFRARGHGNRAENNGMRKITSAQVRSIRSDPRQARAIAAEHGICRDYVYKIKHGLVWRSV